MTWVTRSTARRETGSPSGFVTCADARSAIPPVIVPGETAKATTSSPISASSGQSSQRHRRVGVSPVGKSRKTRMNGASIATIVHLSTQAAATPNGSEP